MGYTFAPVTNRDGLIAMCVIFTVSSTTAVALRFYSRSFIKKVRLEVDDWLAAISLVSLNGITREESPLASVASSTILNRYPGYSFIGVPYPAGILCVRTELIRTSLRCL